MTGTGFFRSKKRVLTCVTVLLACTPLFGWAQGAAPKPTPAPAAPPQTTTLPTPAAAKDSAAKAAAAAPVPAAAAPVPAAMPALSDSARTALKSEIERELKVIADSLKLTPDQRAKARPILLDHAYQVRSLRQKYATQEKAPAVVQAMQKDMQVLRDSTDAKMGSVLTAPQMTQFKTKRDAWLGQTRTRMGMGGPPQAASAAAPAGMPAPTDTAHKAAQAPPAAAPKVAPAAAPKAAPAAAPADTAKKK